MDDDRHHSLWLWVATTLVVAALALLGISAALNVGKTPTVVWETTWEAFLAYGLFGIAVLCVVAAARGWRFPLVPRPNDSEAGTVWVRPVDQPPAAEVLRSGPGPGIFTMDQSGITAGGSIRAGGEISAPGHIRAGIESTSLKIASRRLGTELRDIRLMIERVKATNPMAYPPGFRLPAARWEEYEPLLANYGDLYRYVERAYTAALGVNEVLRLREARQSANMTTTLGVNAEDRLDVAHGAAGEALDALGEEHNDPFRTAPPGEPTILYAGPQPARTREDAQRRRRAALIRFVDRGEEIRGSIEAAVFPSTDFDVASGFILRVQSVHVTVWLSELDQYVAVQFTEDFRQQIPAPPKNPSATEILEVIDETIGLIENQIRKIDEGVMPP
ncbi:MAG TPA: hypothetical protein VG944_00600 [Fimbriimonas sp.]|nr:hypothetical protein [Fimbriimonas sp.]